MPHYENRQVGEANEAPFEVPESWEWTTIGEIASSILYGVSESAKETGQYKLLRITDIQNNKVNWETVPFTDYDNNKAQAYLLNDGDILFARTGATVGKSYLVEGLKDSAIYASYLIRVQTSSVILPAYIKFFFESGFYWEQISLNSVGIGQPNVNGTTLAALTIPIPPYREQLRIVEEAKKWLAVIDVLDVEIEDLQASIVQAKSKILNLAIHGKLVPQDPNDEPAIELLKRINPIFTPCDNAQYPYEVPKSWIWVRLDNICEIKGGKRIPRGETFSSVPTSHIYIRVTNMKNNTIIDNEIKYITEDVYRQIKNYTIGVDDLYLTIAGTIGEVGSVPRRFDGMNLTENAARLTNIVCLKNYLKTVLQSSVAQEHFISKFHQVAQPKLSIETASSTLIPLPPYNEQLRIVAKIQELFAVLDEILKSIEA